MWRKYSCLNLQYNWFLYEWYILRSYEKKNMYLPNNTTIHLAPPRYTSVHHATPHIKWKFAIHTTIDKSNTAVDEFNTTVDDFETI